MAYQGGYYPQGTYQQQGYGWQQQGYGQGQQQQYGGYAAPTPDPYATQGANAWAPPAGVPMYANASAVADPYAMNAQWGQPAQQMYSAPAPVPGAQYPASAYGSAPNPQYAQAAYAAYQPPGYQAQQQYPGYTPAAQPGYAASAYPAQAYGATPQYPAQPAAGAQGAYPTSLAAAYPTSAAQPQAYSALPAQTPQVVAQPPAMSGTPADATPGMAGSVPPGLIRDVSNTGLPDAQPPANAAPVDGLQSVPPLLPQASVGAAPAFDAQANASSAPGLQQQPTVGAMPALNSQHSLSNRPGLMTQQSVGSMNLSSILRPATMDTDVTHSGRLFLEVTRGRNLKNMELFGKQDPYMKLNFKAYKVRTKTHQSGGRTPVWNQTFSFELDGKDPDIMIECYDEDPGKDDFIGGTAVNIQQIVNGKGEEVFVPICNKKGVNTGEVGFKAKFAQYRPAILKFKLVDAKGLPCPDGRKLDPYVIFYVDGDKQNKVLARSRIHVNGGANPVWNQDFNFKLTGKEQYLDLDVWDEDVNADDHCGNARLRFVDLRQANPGTQRYPLTRPGKQLSATIGIAVEFVPIP